RFPLDGLARELARRVAKIETGDDEHLPLTREPHFPAVELLGARDGLIRALERYDVSRAIAERDRDAGRCTQHVDHGDDASRDQRRSDGGWTKNDINAHYGSRNRSLSRSRNLVSTCPA